MSVEEEENYLLQILPAAHITHLTSDEIELFAKLLQLGCQKLPQNSSSSANCSNQNKNKQRFFIFLQLQKSTLSI